MVSPTTQSIRDEGDSGRVDVRASAPTCAWTASSGVPWITVTSGASNAGSGDVRYNVAANTEQASRTGTLMVAGQAVTVTQDGARALTIRLEGEVSGLNGNCPFVTFRLEGRVVLTGPGTDFERSCSSLSNGDDVRVDGIVAPGNAVLAIRIRRDDDDRD
jgi:hypothetical protein